VSDLEKIAAFIEEHHVLSFATTDKEEVSVCSLFYVYDKVSHTFIVASSDETTHVKHTVTNPNIAGNILLETKSVGKIQGLQFRGIFSELTDKSLKKLYFKAFPYALALSPKLWKIDVNYFKMTDNRLGFGKKVIWQAPSV
jgi:uncharacterized protein YhbP (UPF0306 family)